jgi:hypothetical protein
MDMPLELLPAFATMLPRLLRSWRDLVAALRGAQVLVKSVPCFRRHTASSSVVLQGLFEHYSGTQLCSALGFSAQRLLKASLPKSADTLAADLFLRLLKAQRSEEERHRWIEWLNTTLARSESSFTRIRFIALCRRVPVFFSRAYFKEQTLLPLLELSQDPVLQVRQSLGRFLPTVQRMFLLPVDREDIKSFQVAFDQLSSGFESNEVLDIVMHRVHFLAPTCVIFALPGVDGGADSPHGNP